MRAYKFQKIGKFFAQVFKMAVIFKMAENWFFDHNSVSFEPFCVLFYSLSLFFSRAYFIEEKFYVRSKMASDVQYAGQNSKEYYLGIFKYFYVLLSTMPLYFCQQHKPRAYFVKWVKNGGSIQNGRSKSDFFTELWEYLTFFQFSFCILLMSKTQVSWIFFFFSKNPRWRLKHVFTFQPPSWIFEQLFFPQNWRLTNTKWLQKEDWKNVGSSQSYVKISDLNKTDYLILICHFGSNRHFWLIWKNMLLIHVAGNNTNLL
jgi:hypothetical protein